MENWVNIPRSVVDPYHRYRMPIPQLKIEKGKAVVVNIDDIAEALDRSPDIVSKFISLEFNGEYDVDTILNCLDKFIDEYVLCRSCKSPGTYFKLDNKSVIIECWSCDDKFSLNINNNFFGYILENLPNGDEKAITMMLSSHSGRVQSKMLCSECGTKIRKFKNGYICQKNHKILPGSNLYTCIKNSELNS